MLLDLNRKNRLAYAKQFIGEPREVLLETAEDGKVGPVWTGYTPEYLRLRVTASDGMPGQYVSVTVKEENLLLTEE